MEIILLLFLGIVTGICIGMFPFMPIYAGAFVLYFTIGILTPEQMILFWAVASIGSQFFSSVSAIGLGIPGEASTTAYISDIKKLSLSEKNQLLYLTSKGSLTSSLIAFIIVWGLYHLYQLQGNFFLSSVEIKITMLYTVLLILCYFSKNRLATFFLVLGGLLLAPKNNYALPDIWYSTSLFFQNTTFFMLILGFLLAPDLLFDKQLFDIKSKEHFIPKNTKTPWYLILKNSLLGCLVGSIPGPAAEVSSVTAYNLQKGKPYEKIIAAETANNPGVIMMILPLTLLGLPFTGSSLIMQNILEGRAVDIIELVKTPSLIISSFIVFDVLIALCCVTVLIYFLLSVRFIDYYINFLRIVHHRIKTILFIILGTMLYFDMTVQEVSFLSYSILLTFYLILGILFKKYKINPIPFIFLNIMGDTVVWTTIQFYTIYF